MDKTLLIVDIDGTLADFTHRSHLVEGDRKNDQRNWDQFIHPENMIKDPIFPHCRRILEKLAMRPRTSLVYLTGRGHLLRDVTKLWLLENMGSVLGTEPLFMRRSEDEGVPATKFKGDVIRDLVKLHNPKHILCFDDDWYMYPVYESFGGIVFRAPDCWKTMFPEAKNLEPEVGWRK